MRNTLTTLILLASTSAMAVPLEANHQGRLFDNVGAPLTGDHDLSFALYDDVAGTTSVWSETLTDVTFDNGYFSVQLGQTSALDSSVLDGDMLYLGITVDTGSELPDRVAVVSVPYAVRAGVAGGVDGGVVDASEVMINGTTVIDSSGNIDGSLITGGTDNDLLADLGCSDDQLAVVRSGSWSCVDESALTIAPAQVSGVLADTQLPVGTGSTNVAAGDHGHTAVDVGALPSGTTPADIGALPTGATPADIGAAPANAVRTDCQAHLAAGVTGSGVYAIDPDGAGPSPEFPVYCDQETNGGGWMRLQLHTRQWGNTLGFTTDPITTWGSRVTGPNSQSNLDDLTSCGGDSAVSMAWSALDDLDNRQFDAIVAAVSEGMVADYYAYDADGAANWDQVKGCTAGAVVMTGDGDESGGANHVWSGPYAVDSLTAPFDTGYYGGNADVSGYNVSLPRYWYFR